MIKRHWSGILQWKLSSINNGILEGLNSVIQAALLKLGDIVMALGLKIKELRLNKKKSLQEVANAIKISKTHIWEIERGTAKNPSLNLLESLSSYFGETIDSLINDDNKIDKNKSFARKIKGMNLSDADYEKLEFAAEMLKSRQSD
jgi:transcriptional regulator with XRE-family HTH domain